jgi:hypothetical protein
LDAFFDKKRFDHTFFTWTGFTKQGTLFSVNRSTPLPKAPTKAAAPAPAKAPAKGPAKAPAKAG